MLHERGICPSMPMVQFYLLKTCKTTYYVLFTNTETCRKNIKTHGNDKY